MTQFGAYIVERAVEPHGKVTVYAAKHETTGEMALITAFTPDSMDQAYQWSARLTTIQKLHHPNIIVPMEGSRTTEGVPFAVSVLAMPLLGRSRTLSPAMTLDITRQLADALDYAHQQGIIHGLLRPVHVSSMGGIGCVLRGFELAGGEPGDYTLADDIAGLGQFVHRALVGHPFEGITVSPRLSPLLAETILKTSREYGKEYDVQGYSSAGQFYVALTQAVASLPVAQRKNPLVIIQETETGHSFVSPSLKKRGKSKNPNRLGWLFIALIILASLGFALLNLGAISSLLLPPQPTVAALSAALSATETAIPAGILSGSTTSTLTPSPTPIQNSVDNNGNNVTTSVETNTGTTTATPAVISPTVSPQLSPEPPTLAPIDLTETSSAQTMSTLPSVVTATPFTIASDTPGPTVIGTSALTQTSTTSTTNEAPTATNAEPLPETSTEIPTVVPQASKPCVSLVGDSVTHGGVTYNIPDVGYIIGLTKPLADFLNEQLQAQGINDLIAYDRGASNTGINSPNHPSYFRTPAYAQLLEDYCRYTVIMPWFNDITPGRTITQQDAAPQHVRSIIELVRTIAARDPSGRIFILNYYDGAVAPFAASTWATGFTPTDRELYNREIKLSCDFGSLSKIPQVSCLNSNDAFQGMGNSYVIGTNTIQDVKANLIYPLTDIQEGWLDDYAALNPGGLLEGDGIHLSPAGKTALSAYLVQAIQSLPPLPMPGQ